ncbi:MULTISPECIES: ABC transporter ATP-binding protein [Haloferacaceae]|uniref:ABC-type D-xylose/L-arabinose transporter n=1 Tax=Halorubrum glutamatedens TaxID=2707018 RepID=A0ABD5QSZ9_9EURY|nr:ABC transporter ATP-binding protein [Halobellus captivus]
MAQLTFDDVRKTFQEGNNEIVAVDDLNMEVRDGEFLVVVGPSGCGKTTTLRMVAGLETITEGQIELDGRSIRGMSPQDRNIAMVFQSYALYPHMTVFDNMAFGLRESTDLSEDEIDDLVTETSEMLDIKELLNRKPSELSGGQQQRVALGRAIVRDPDAFLMDEPLSNLDAKLRAEMRTELQRLQEEFETTTIYVTHDQTEAMTMGDRIAILDHGELQQIGTPMECYYEPANEFVAGFIGEPSMNFLRGTSDGGVLRMEDFSYELSQSTVESIGSTTEITLGVRPEDVEVVPEATQTNDVAVEVDVVEPFGKENNLYLKPEGSDTDDTIIATVGGRKSVNEGERVGMRLPEEHLYLFDRSDGTAIRHPTVEAEEITPVAE